MLLSYIAPPCSKPGHAPGQHWRGDISKGVLLAQGHQVQVGGGGIPETEIAVVVLEPGLTSQDIRSLAQ